METNKLPRKLKICGGIEFCSWCQPFICLLRLFSGQEALGDLPSGVAKLISVASLCFWILYLPSPDRYGSSIVRSHGWSSWHEGTDAVQDVKVFFFVKERKRWIIIHHQSSIIIHHPSSSIIINLHFNLRSSCYWRKTPSYKKPECLVDRLYSTPPGGAVLVNEWRVFGAIWWHAKQTTSSREASREYFSHVFCGLCWILSCYQVWLGW